jgi:hypothetical protein
MRTVQSTVSSIVVCPHCLSAVAFHFGGDKKGAAAGLIERARASPALPMRPQHRHSIDLEGFSAAFPQRDRHSSATGAWPNGAERREEQRRVGEHPDAALHAGLLRLENAKPAATLLIGSQRNVRGSDRARARPEHAEQRLTRLAKVLKPGACKVIEISSSARLPQQTHSRRRRSSIS